MNWILNVEVWTPHNIQHWNVLLGGISFQIFIRQVYLLRTSYHFWINSAWSLTYKDAMCLPYDYLTTSERLCPPKPGCPTPPNTISVFWGENKENNCIEFLQNLNVGVWLFIHISVLAETSELTYSPYQLIPRVLCIASDPTEMHNKNTFTATLCLCWSFFNLSGLRDETVSHASLLTLEWEQVSVFLRVLWNKTVKAWNKVRGVDLLWKFWSGLST